MDYIPLAVSAAQIVVALSIAIVWVFRYDNIIREFKQYGLSNSVRVMVGSAKIVLATLLVVGIWHDELVVIPAILMALLMVSAQYFHFKVANPFIKRVPSLFLLVVCVFIALYH